MAQTQQVRGVATTVRTVFAMTHVQYHDTIVVSFDQEHIRLDSGGWLTNTTKTRMNQASNQFGLGYTVYQKDYQWFVEFDNKTIPFKDGMVLSR